MWAIQIIRNGLDQDVRVSQEEAGANGPGSVLITTVSVWLFQGLSWSGRAAGHGPLLLQQLTVQRFSSLSPWQTWQAQGAREGAESSIS